MTDDLFPDQLTDTLPDIDRASGLLHLEAFAGKAGHAYAKGRNFDLGPSRHHLVSCLSAHLRRRLLTEDEVIDAVLARHSFPAAEKFITEVYWRTYFKGWLEMRPSVWQHWLSELTRLPHTDAVETACSGQTGIDCFDFWADELVRTGYLHNHARMWFASVWIFTLRLPWQQGAAFFMKYLRDGDPASNTLGWRWVAGLQTRGKAYAARAENIDQFTRGRFAPHGRLNEQVFAVDGPENPSAQPIMMPSASPVVADGVPYLLVLAAEDCHPESLALPHAPAVLVSLPSWLGNYQIGADLNWLRDAQADRLDQAALTDTLARARAHFAVPQAATSALDVGRDGQSDHLLDQTAEQLAELCRQHQISDLVTAYLPVGFWQSHYQRLCAHPALSGVRSHFVMRDYDRRAWPSATKGFFPFKSKIPGWLNQR